MAWAAEVAATQLTSITDTEQFFDETPTLNPRETAHVVIDFVPQVSSPTENLQVNVYTSLDGSAWDDSPAISMVIDNATTPNQAPIVISGVYQFRIGVHSTSSSDTHVSADMNYRLDGVDA